MNKGMVCWLQETPVEAGPPIAAVGVSLDGRLLTLQRSPAHLEFLARDGPNMFLQARTLAPALHGCLFMQRCLRREGLGTWHTAG